MSIKTEIEWFTLEEKFPDKKHNGKLVLIYNFKNEMETCYLCFNNKKSRIFCDFFFGFTPFNEIKYWAFFPEITEVI